MKYLNKMKNSEQPAFPHIVVETDPIDGSTIRSVEFNGLTKREYFAAHAPDVPDWFEGTHPPEPKKPTEHWTKWPDDNPHKKLVKDWRHEWDFIYYDLPEELKWYQDLWEQYWKEKAKYESEKPKIRYFQWRAYYADMMLAELEKPTTE